MSITFNIVKTNPDKTVVLEEKNTSTPQLKPRKYVLPEENVDKFKKAKQANETLNRMNTIMTPLLAISTGFFTAGRFKSILKGSLSGIAVAGAALFGLHRFDKMIRKQSEINVNTKFDAKEVIESQEIVESQAKEQE